MKLELLSNLAQNAKNNYDVQNFIKELDEFMNENILNNKQNLLKKNELPILEQIQNKRKTSLIYKNEMRNKQSEILINYANESISKGIMYFVSKKASNQKNTYNVRKIENGKVKTIKLNEKDLPSEIEVNSVFRENNFKYVLDEIATKEINEQIIKMVNELLDKQDEELSNYRKEGHLYMVTEEINDRRFLLDLTSMSKFEIEEVDFPKELLGIATEGTVFIYSKGEYKYYSKDGFDRLENKEDI